MCSCDVIVRDARRADVSQVMKLIRELAEFDETPEAVKINEKTLETDGFDTVPPLFMAFVVEDKGKPDFLVGYALCNIGYSTWLGNRLYIEDIMVTQSYRGRGVGTKLFSYVCKEALKLGCEVINFAMIDWNPGAKFFKKMGVVDTTEVMGWHWNVIHQENIVKVAAEYKE